MFHLLYDWSHYVAKKPQNVIEMTAFSLFISYKTHRAALIKYSLDWPGFRQTLTLLFMAVFSHTPLSPYLPRPEQTASSLAFYLSINISPPAPLLTPTPSLSAHTLTSLSPPLSSPSLLSGDPFHLSSFHCQKDGRDVSRPQMCK